MKRIHKNSTKIRCGLWDRYSVDLQLGLPHTEKSYRFSDRSTCIKKKGTNSLCFPEGIEWNGNATVYIIVSVKDQGRWVYHFINDLTVASLLTGDKNSKNRIADFELPDVFLSKELLAKNLSVVI